MNRLAAAALALLLGACSEPAPQTWSPGLMTEVGPTLNNFGQATVPVGGLIVFQGDDLLYGTSAKGGAPGISGASAHRSPNAVPETVYKAFNRRVNVELRTFPGDTIRAGMKRWAGRPFGNLLVLSYGYGDAKANTPAADFRAALVELIAAARSAGAATFLIVPPASSNGQLNGKLEPFRAIMRELRGNGVSVFEAAETLAAAKQTPAKTAAQTDTGYRDIGGAMVPYIRIAAPP